MNNFDIKAFLAIVEKGSFSAASETLIMTQSALSQRIRILEEELGYPLFIRQRGHRQVTLTPEGITFSSYAQQIDRLMEASYQLGREKQRETLRVSVIESVMHYSMPHLFRTFLARYPDIRFTLTSYYSHEAYQMIENGQLDLAIVGKLHIKPNSNIYITPLYADRWVFVCSKDADYPEIIDAKKLNAHDQLLMFTNEKADWIDYWTPDPKKAWFVGDTTSFYNAEMFNGNTWAIIPNSIACTLKKQDICDLRELSTAPPDRMIYAVSNRMPDDDHLNKIMTSMRDELLLNTDIRVL